MNTRNQATAVRALTLAVQGALAAMTLVAGAAMAEGEDDVKALTQPHSTIAVGAEDTTGKNGKYGEYNGLYKDGVKPLIDFDLRGGSGYQPGDGTLRWSLIGNDLGTTSRSLGAGVGSQGSWSLGINYDQLRHFISDTYQTPLVGPMGGNSFSAPGNFGVVNTQVKPAAVGGVIPPYGAQALSAAQMGDFHRVDVWSERKNSNLTAGVQLSREWGLQFEFNHLQQDGAKLLAAGTDVQNKGAFSAVRGENILVLMNPTNYRTDQLTAVANWRNDHGWFSGGYYGSYFRDANQGLNFPNVFTGTAVGLATGAVPPGGFPVDTMSTAPDNNFHQLNFTGGYVFSPATRASGGLSVGRNTQNANYVNQDQMQAGGLPVNSLNGDVRTLHADARLTSQVSRQAQVSVGLRYNERENRTPANTYKFLDLGGATETSINTPMSNRRTQLDAGVDWHVAQAQTVHLAYEFERMERWCKQGLSNTAQGPGPGGPSAAALAYYNANPGTCAQVPASEEHRFIANWRTQATDDLSLNAGVQHAMRQSDFVNSWYNPMQANNQGYELPGYRAFFDASRTQNTGKLGLAWQATRRLDVNLSGRISKDNYENSPLGVQNGSSWSLNLDAGYRVSDDASVNAYATSQRRSRDLLNGVWSHATATFYAAPVQTWLNTLGDSDLTLGLGMRQAGLLAGKLALKGDVTASYGRSAYATYDRYVNAACAAPSNAGYACNALPDIYTKMLQVKLSGDYSIDAASAVILGASYQRLNTNDYFYNAYQFGTTPTSMLPTAQQAPVYSIATVYAAYRYTFW